MKDGQRFLHSIYHEQKELDRLIDLAGTKRMSALPGTLLPKEVQVQTSRRLDPMGDALAECADLTALIEPKVYALRQHRSDAMDMIYKLEDPRHRTILLLRYIKITENGERPSWDEIADAMGHEYRYTLKIHQRAISAFECVYAAARSV